MNQELAETLYFRYCRTLNGDLVPLDCIKRNGRLVPRFSPEQLEPLTLDGASDLSEWDELIAEITQNLTVVERRTWLDLLDGKSILDLAATDKVSRAAVYERIRGNSKGHGGMVSKNPYVEIWWRLRKGGQNER